MTDIQELAKRVDELSSKEAIRDCLYRVDRGIDRIDVNILRTAFHPDAKVQWGTPESMPVSEWLQKIDFIRQITRQAQHLIGNVLIKLRGDTADVESYEVARHLTLMGTEWKDMVYAARYLDKFSRRDGEWKIDSRIKMMDWGRIMEGSDSIFADAALKARRDAEDLSYQVFGANAFI